MNKKDVIVVGGGTAGFAAAIAAARNGANVALIERSTSLGGTMTGGLVPGLVSLRHQPWRDQSTLAALESSYEGEQVVRGIAQEFVDNLVKSGGAYGRVGETSVRVAFDPEIAKWVIDDMVGKAGVEVVYRTEVVDVIKTDTTVTGVRLNDRTDMSAHVVIDATGDGTVSYLAGAKYELGKDNDSHFVQPISFYFLLGNVNIDKTIEYLATGSEELESEYVETVRRLRKENKPFTIIGFAALRERAMKDGRYPIPVGTTDLNARAHNSIFRPVFRNGRTRYDVTAHNVDMAYRVDPTSVKEMSHAITGMRRVAIEMAEFFRQYVPGFEDAYLAQVAEQVGVRESRRVLGDYVLSGQEALAGARFEDSIGFCGATVDVHNEKGGTEPTLMTAIKNGGAYQVPYRVLLPKGVEGLMLAGRCVSTDRIASGSLRQQAGCLVTGQAAGTAAAMACSKRIQPRDLDVTQLQKILESQEVIL